MDLHAKKLEVVQLILNTNKPKLLDMISEILKKEVESDWWDEIDDEAKKSIEQGLAEANRGELEPHENVMKEIKAKYGL